MAKEFDGISRDTYMNSDPQTGRSLTYDMLAEIRSLQVDIKEGCSSKRDACNTRFEKIENRKKFDTTLAGTTGLIGGVIAFLMQITFFKKL